MNGAEKALKLHGEGFNCAQSVFGAYCERLGVNAEVGLKLSCALGGGLAQLRGRCGAVTGACLLIGLKHGMFAPGDVAAKAKTYELTRDFIARFEERNTTTICRELLTMKPQYDNDSPAKPGAMSICNKAIYDATQIIEEMLEL